jgi:hypothetical protein
MPQTSGPPVELRRPPGPRPGAPGPPRERHLQQPGVDQLVEMERDERAADAQRRGDLVAPHRLHAGLGDHLVRRPPHRVGQQGQRL